MENLTRHPGLVTRREREAITGCRGHVLWFTGLSGSGKSTLAVGLEQSLVKQGRLAYVLDGDNLRHGLNRDLGFSPQDRGENIRRVAEVAALFADAGLVVLTSFISPYRGDRELARQLIGSERFSEVFVDPGLEVCEARDPKGLYKLARSGRLSGFTGVDAPYEPPEAPALRLDTGRVDQEGCLVLLLEFLNDRGVVPGKESSDGI